ncbi:MAG: electron transfer flavoprotein subunit alpha/FixB family protein [Thermoleophilia bacterium]|nr:electron transfer flavoprotein subunit alpha/FixB family protein [Thermoleophilia bacterium]
MPGILVVAEHSNGRFRRVSLEVLTKARELKGALGGPLAAVVAGSGVADAAGELGQYGAETVYVADHEALGSGVAAGHVDVVAGLQATHDFSAILIGATALGKDLAAALAVRLGAGLNGDSTELTAAGAGLRARRPVFGGQNLVDAEWTGGPAIALVRPNSFKPEPNGGSASVESVTPELGPVASAVKVTGRKPAEEGKISLEEASIIVSGGRGLGAPENFSYVEALAKELGAAVGASRAAVDAGWYPHPSQVGQTGKTVSPNLYIACGISGAIQHKVGMQTSDVIVAVNKDEEAPIFGFADFGVVGDLFEILPKLTELVAARKAG